MPITMLYLHLCKSNTHTSILEPALESGLARLRPADIRATLGDDPLHQPFLQFRVVFLINLTLYLAAQTIGGPFVCHADPAGREN